MSGNSSPRSTAVTIFATPKPFTDHAAVAQRNAIASWSWLVRPEQIILFGDSAGTAEICEEFGLQHEPKVTCNEFGTPLLNDMFSRALSRGDTDWFCYVNADIMLLPDTLEASAAVIRQEPRALLVARRHNVDLDRPWDFSMEDWQGELRRFVRRAGTPAPASCTDIFIFHRDVFGEIPPFAVGRWWFDVWLLWRARDRGAKVIDGTEAFLVIHQNHGYEHVPGGTASQATNPEALRNLELCGDSRHYHTIDHARYRLKTDGSIRRALAPRYVAARRREAWRWTLRNTSGIRASGPGRVVDRAVKDAWLSTRALQTRVRRLRE